METNGSILQYLSELLSYENYSFSWDDLLDYSNKSESALRSELSRLVKHKEVVNIRQGFYLILPPVYRRFGRLPIELFADRLFKYLKKPYYLACLSAAKFHGAGHQQIQNDQIIIPEPAMRDIHKSAAIRLFTSRHWPSKNILSRKSDTGYFNISSPALTAADLVHYQAKIGGLNHLYSVFEELSEELKFQDVEDLLTWYPHISVLQRLGYIFEKIPVEQSIADLVYGELQKRRFFPILFLPEKGKKAGSTGNRWKVDANAVLESDL